ncbi:DUF3597 domain-containing protein [Pseudomonas sp. B392_1p]|uniref:DUF3597 domain-containing protein n=1 Tax=Pseudomonas sp. B392_1p TaxID=3457507 RepID=UPI003FCFF497
MGLFDRIKEKLGFGHDDKTVPTSPQPSTSTVADANRPDAASNATTVPGAGSALGGVGDSSTMSTVDVTAKLDGMAASHSEQLNWRTSIVDLLKLLGLDSSLEHRKELATELGCPPQLMSDSAQMNTWLHKTVMQKLAQHGGTIPPELLT